MSHKHPPWRPSPAAKPTHLASTVTAPSQSLAAVRGAATAFASRPIANPPTVTQLRNQYETGFVAGQHEKRRGRSPGEYNETLPTNTSPYRSPSRGRHLNPESAQLAGARSAASSSASPVPAPLDRAKSSMIAARIASASPSPVRDSASPSPPKGTGLPQEKTVRESKRSMGTISSPRPTAPSRQPSQYNEPPKKSSSTVSNVDFNNLPKLLPTSPITIPGRQTNLHGSNGSGSPVTQQKPPAPAPRMMRTMSERNGLSFEHNRGTQGTLAQPRPIRTKPPPPVPRHTRDIARSPLQASPITAQSLQGLTRDEVINRMADAMVASSLASARTPSPSKMSRNHTGRRRSASAHNVYRKPVVEEIPVPKLPSHLKAPRPMKQTLRKLSPDDEDDNEVTRRGRRHLMRKHPNMHQEGDRKRWRDKITESERKRYEGVFAANRGLLLRPPDRKTSPSRLIDPNSEGNQVVNVIVRDIWDRSRLPIEVLEQIYDLVAADETMCLNREQFVVGLWLIDQKLKGRKLPVRVSESVWASVRHSQGIRVSSKNMQ